MHTSGRDPVYVGEFVHSDFDDARLSTGPDYGLIEIESRYFDNIVTTPRVSMSDESVQIRGYADTSWLEANEPYICQLGFRTGLSDGSFEEITNQYTVTFANITYQGDSGGVIEAFDPNDSSMQNIYAVAVNSYGSDYDATMAGGKLVEPIMTDFGFAIFQLAQRLFTNTDAVWWKALMSQRGISDKGDFDDHVLHNHGSNFYHCRSWLVFHRN